VVVSLKSTVNMGNYESMNYGLSVSAQANHGFEEEVRKELTEYAEKVLADKVKEYRGMTETTDEVVFDFEE